MNLTAPALWRIYVHVSALGGIRSVDPFMLRLSHSCSDPCATEVDGKWTGFLTYKPHRKPLNHITYKQETTRRR